MNNFILLTSTDKSANTTVLVNIEHVMSFSAKKDRLDREVTVVAFIDGCTHTVTESVAKIAELINNLKGGANA